MQWDPSDVVANTDDPSIGGYRYWTPGDLVWIDPGDGHELWSTEAECNRGSINYIRVL